MRSLHWPATQRMHGPLFPRLTKSICTHDVDPHNHSNKTGPRDDAVLDIAWHPTSAAFVAVAAGGRLYVWARVVAENWSAFAPDFKVREGG